MGLGCLVCPDDALGSIAGPRRLRGGPLRQRQAKRGGTWSRGDCALFYNAPVRGNTAKDEGTSGMNISWNRRGWHYALLLGVGALLFLVNLGGATLWDVDEGKNFTCTTEMRAWHTYVIPSFGGE